MIRIAIDARPFAGPPCGYTTYLESIIECLRRDGVVITLISNQPLRKLYADAFSGCHIVCFGQAGQFKWEQVDLPKHLSDAKYDIYFSGANRGMPLLKSSGTRYILGFLDAIPFLFFRDYHLRHWKRYLRHPSLGTELLAQLIAVMRADAILTISKQSARDIKRLFHRKSVTAILIRLKVAPQLPLLPPEAKFVYVGGVDFRKKVDVLIKGFAIFSRSNPTYQLILVGANYSSLDTLIETLGLRNRVVYTGFVDHETKLRIMRESLAMIYPSLYEGYGLAIAEGFQAQIPVVAGRGGAQAEVGGMGAYWIDPSSATDIAAAMSEIMLPTVRKRWIAQGQEQLARLTDPSIANLTTEYFFEQARLSGYRDH